MTTEGFKKNWFPCEKISALIKMENLNSKIDSNWSIHGTLVCRFCAICSANENFIFSYIFQSKLQLAKKVDIIFEIQKRLQNRTLTIKNVLKSAITTIAAKTAAAENPLNENFERQGSSYEMRQSIIFPCSFLSFSLSTLPHFVRYTLCTAIVQRT